MTEEHQSCYLHAFRDDLQGNDHYLMAHHSDQAYSYYSKHKSPPYQLTITFYSLYL